MARFVKTVAEDADLLSGLTTDSSSMLSPGEIVSLYMLTRMYLPPDGRIAELGAYLGGTTCVFGEALRRLGYSHPCLEVYDFFEHNESSRKRLSQDPDFEPDSFFRIWERNTTAYRQLIELHRGDLREEANKETVPLDTLYVDVVKHDSLINPVMQKFVPRLRVGGLLIHQDYFHWQSPWVVYSTERIIDHCEIIGTVSNHTMILKLAEPVPRIDIVLDYVDGLSRTEILALMGRAIQRYPGIRRGLLRVSLVNLAASWDEFDAEAEIAGIRADYEPDSRVVRYLDAATSLLAGDDANPMW